MLERDLSEQLQHRVRQAVAESRPLRIVGNNSKAFYGATCQAEDTLEVREHSGLIDYEPSELVITARAGTRLSEITKILSEQRQMLGFEPPDFAGQATLGGTLACGFSGPRRPFAGSARDVMLGCKLINGQAEMLNFGGRVMKNVAGFDVSRLMVGALGTLGVMLEVSLRVMPMPEAEVTRSYELPESEAITKMNTLSALAWPLSAMAYDGDRLLLRLSGAPSAVQFASGRLGGEVEADGERIWLDLKEQRLPFFHLPGTLWRISVAPATQAMDLSGHWCFDWGGALRWLKTELPADTIHNAAARAGGYAVCFSGDDKHDWIRLDASLAALQRNIRSAFDPQLLFNPGRLRF